MKTFTAGQEQIRSQACIDQDGDGIGEYGLLTELSGAANFRGSSQNCANAPFIPSPFGNIDKQGVSYKKGYCFIIYVAGKDESYCDATPNAIPDSDKQEDGFIAYAFPVKADPKKGIWNSVFALSEQGQIMRLSNTACIWHKDNPPPPGLAMKDGLDPACGSGEFVQKGDYGGAFEAWRPIG